MPVLFRSRANWYVVLCCVKCCVALCCVVFVMVALPSTFTHYKLTSGLIYLSLSDFFACVLCCVVLCCTTIGAF